MCCSRTEFANTAVPADNQQPPLSPNGPSVVPYTYPFSQVPVKKLPGGTVKIADSRNFKVAKTIAVAEVTVEPGSMRELHVGGCLDRFEGCETR